MSGYHGFRTVVCTHHDHSLLFCFTIIISAIIIIWAIVTLCVLTCFSISTVHCVVPPPSFGPFSKSIVAKVVQFFYAKVIFDVNQSDTTSLGSPTVVQNTTSISSQSRPLWLDYPANILTKTIPVTHPTTPSRPEHILQLLATVWWGHENMREIHFVTVLYHQNQVKFFTDTG